MDINGNTHKKRTNKQSRSIHKIFNDLAILCLDQNVTTEMIDQALTNYRCLVDEHYIKSVWRRIQYTKTGKMSTTELTSKEIDAVYDEFNLFFSENFAIHIPFPSLQDLMLEEWYDK